MHCRNERFEKQEFQKRVIDNYYQIFKNNNKVISIDANQPFNVLEKQLYDVLIHTLSTK